MGRNTIMIQPGVIWLDRNGFSFYISGASSILRFNFLPDTVKHLEVIDASKLELQIQTFIEQNRISPANLYLIFSPPTQFEKIFSNTPESQLIIEKQQFLDNVPFEKVYSRIWKDKQNNSKLVVVNGNLFDDLKSIFGKFGSTLEVAVPSFVIGKDFFDQELAKSILNKTDFLRQENIIREDINNNENILQEEENYEQKKSSLPFLLMIFVILFLLLLFVFLPQLNKKTVTSSFARPKATPTPTITLIPSLSPTINQELPTPTITNTLKVQILNGSGIAGQAETVKKQLTEIGFKNIDIGNANIASNLKTLIIFSPSVTDVIRQEVVSAIKKILPKFSTQESQDLQYDIIITTGKDL